MATKNKLKYISPAMEGYDDLGVEIISLHSSIGSNAKEIEDVKESIKNIDISTTSEINSRLTVAEEDINTLQTEVVNVNDKLQKIHDNNMNTGYENVSINKEYTYDLEGRIIKETSTGDMNRTVIYNYNTNDLIESEVIYENDIEVGRKTYFYNLDGDVYKIKSTNGDTINLAVMDYALKDVDGRLTNLEKYIQLGPNSDINKIYKILSDIGVQLEAVNSLLPENITSLIDIPRLLERMDILEDMVNRQHTKFKFIVIGGRSEYDIPEEITENTSVFLEGLLLDYGDDYIVKPGHMIFNIPLIDGFEVQCKY